MIRLEIVRAQQGIEAGVAVRLDMAEMQRVLSPIQLRAMMHGIGQIVRSLPKSCAQRSTTLPER